MNQRLVSVLGNVGSLLLALILAVSVWVNAVSSEDPNQTLVYPVPIPVTVTELKEGLIAQGYENVQAEVTILAATSLIKGLQPSDFTVFANLKGKGTGEYTVPLEARLDRSPGSIEKISPSSIVVTIDTFESRTFAVHSKLVGNPAAGYQAAAAEVVPNSAMVSGPAAAVDRVAEVAAFVTVEGLREQVVQTTPLLALDTEGKTVLGVTIDPATAVVTVPINQLGGYRDFVVKTVIVGTVKSGYRLTGMTVTPAVVTLYSDNPDLIRSLPGYVETEPLDITGAQADVNATLILALPPGVTVIGDPNIQITVSISAIEDSVTFPLQSVRYQGLDQGLTVTLSPAAVDVIISGPVSDLRKLRTSDIDVYLDLTGLGPGSYKLHLSSRILNEALSDLTISLSPEQVIVTIGPAATPTP